jgi:hypothetical protein
MNRRKLMWYGGITLAAASIIYAAGTYFGEFISEKWNSFYEWNKETGGTPSFSRDVEQDLIDKLKGKEEKTVENK